MRAHSRSRLAGVVLALAALLGLGLRPAAQAAEGVRGLSLWQGAEVRHLLTPALAGTLHLTPTDQFAILGDAQAILLTGAGDLFDLANRQAVPTEEPLKLDAFADSAGLLVTIRGDRLGWLADGRVRERIRLPAAGLRLAAGARQRLYLYGRQGEGSVVYLLDENRVLLLLQIPHGQISALTAIGERLFFAVGNVIYTVATGERPALTFVAHGEDRIRSLVPDPATGLLYFSAGKAVYAMRAGVAIAVLRGLAGYLRYSQGALYVLDPVERRLVRLSGLEKLTGAGPAEIPAPPPVTLKE